MAGLANVFLGWPGLAYSPWSRTDSGRSGLANVFEGLASSAELANALGAREA